MRRWVCRLRVCAPMSFDTEVAGCSVATGFVVDKEQGLILTNRPPPYPSQP